MTPDVFDQQIQVLHERLRALQLRTDKASASQSSLSAEALEELAVAMEELSQQNEELCGAQQELEIERQRYQELFEFAPDGYLVTDIHGIIREANQAATTLLHVPQDSLIGKPLSVFVAEGDHRALRTLLLHLQARRHGGQELEMHVQPRKGGSFPAAFTMAPVCNLQGDVASVRWLLRNITARKQLEQELRTLNAELEHRVQTRTRELSDANQALQSETAKHKQTTEELRERQAMLDAILQNTQALVYLLDTNGHYLYVNRRFEEVFQVDKDAMRGKSIDEIFPPHVATRFNVNNRAVLANATPLAVEETVRHPDGQSRVYHSLKAPLLDRGGAPHGIVGVATDITAHKRAEEALRTNEQFLSRLLETAPLVIYVFDVARGGSGYVNSQAAILLGYEATEVRDLGALEFLARVMHPEDHVRLAKHFARFTSEEEGEVLDFEYRMRHRSGEWRWFRSRDTVFTRTETGQIQQILGAAVDITAQKQAEEARRYSEKRYRRLAHEREQQLIASDRRISFGELAASLAHEFNNPLGIILGFAQDMLKDVTPDHPFHHCLHIIESEAQRCRRLMERLRDFARPAPMQLYWTDPANIIRTSLDLVAGQCRKQWVIPTLELPPTLPRIYADSQQLQQVLINLFFNALEAMPKGGTLTVGATVAPSSAQLNEDAVSEVVVTVADTGTGIAADHQVQIFRPFFTTKTKEGMGLGLSICESIMTAHGGRIAVESRVGDGTTFSLFFPVTG